MLRQVEYKGFNIFYYENKYVEVGKKIIENDYKTIKILKDTKRNYVSAIEIDGNNYIVKEPRNEYIIPQRKLMSFFKKGEALTTLININKLINTYKIKEYVKPLTLENYEGLFDFEERDNLKANYELLVFKRFRRYYLKKII